MANVEKKHGLSKEGHDSKSEVWRVTLDTENKTTHTSMYDMTTTHGEKIR